MTDSATKDQVDAAKAYEALFIPALLGQWAPKVADAAGLRPGHRVLDVACGTGILAREAHARVGTAGSVSGLDPNPGMLAVAKELEPALDWRQGTAESLPFPDASYDAVVSQFGLMFTKVDRALREMLRVLKPGGPLVVAVWDAVENIPAYAAEVELFERAAGHRAADALRAPFVLGDREALEQRFRDAGAVSIKSKTPRGVARFPSIRVFVEADLRGWLPVMGVSLAEEQIRRILDEAEVVLRPHATGDGRVAFDVTAHLVAARKADLPGGVDPIPDSIS
jgi:ubiquinone/menaquinone biosynthesis C-methylase UbiE